MSADRDARLLVVVLSIVVVVVVLVVVMVVLVVAACCDSGALVGLTIVMAAGTQLQCSGGKQVQRWPNTASNARHLH